MFVASPLSTVPSTGNFSELELKSEVGPLPYAHTPLTTVCIQILQSQDVVVAHHLYTPEFLLGNR